MPKPKLINLKVSPETKRRVNKYKRPGDRGDDVINAILDRITLLEYLVKEYEKAAIRNKEVDNPEPRL
jgi:hypothetical protein